MNVGKNGPFRRPISELLAESGYLGNASPSFLPYQSPSEPSEC